MGGTSSQAGAVKPITTAHVLVDLHQSYFVTSELLKFGPLG
jgi:hypothetical protein